MVTDHLQHPVYLIIYMQKNIKKLNATQLSIKIRTVLVHFCVNLFCELRPTTLSKVPNLTLRHAEQTKRFYKEIFFKYSNNLF